MTPFEWFVALLVGVAGAITTVFCKYYMPKMPSTDNLSDLNLDIEAPEPEPVPTPRPMTSAEKIRCMAFAQQKFEGWWPGSASYKRNNPGNCKGLDGNFLTFETYEEGLAYLEDYIKRVALGKHKAYPKGGKTLISEYVRVYTSDPEPSPRNYAIAISTALEVPVSTPLSYLLS